MSDTNHGVTRRQIISGLGGVAALGAVSLASSRAGAEGKWNHEADVIVVGTGIAATTAAYIARRKGNSVTMLEKAGYFGGTTAKSAGVLWIPNNFILRQRGIDDNKADCLRYLARFSFPQRYNPSHPTLGLDQHAYSLLEAFYDNSATAVDVLREQNVLKLHEWRMFHLDNDAPDYLAVPENKVPSGRALGVTIGDGTTGLGAHLMQQMKAAIDKQKIPVMLEHRVERAVLNEHGRVVGIEAAHGDKTMTFKARKAVVFATGGYAHNTLFIDNYQRGHIYGACASPASTGDFINIAGAAGARMGNLSSAWRTQILLEPALADRALSSGVFFPPGDSMLQVNRYGRRVVNEKRNYNDRTEVHNTYNPTYAEFPNQIMFMVYDKRTAEAFAGAYPLPAEPTDAAYVMQADTPKKLAAVISKRLRKISSHTGGFELDASFAENLQATIARFNEFARAGNDEDFQRGAAAYDREWQLVFSPMREQSGWPQNEQPNITMHSLSDNGPYFAIMLAAGALDTNGGPMVDAKARVLDTRGQPIPGLYAAGNCIASPSGDAYWAAGCTIGLALTFGYIAGNAAHDEA
ncbi:MAG: FAD-dependent oxidoreductase [Gammaproteobacteria bacterium]